ncbi:hypothetical protein M7I_0142 [Glarea lozoyensis 74030]|uniref:Uncharacterized protein n=1 Tax=Glarea lozoyensis (strain ATCC 74030 / MF5533) TaxID=1104152 RepID=H0ECK0_GLAL7|nr:hypothetical protein M7I_0142 [Glarea lozoyensis 74030]
MEWEFELGGENDLWLNPYFWWKRYGIRMDLTQDLRNFPIASQLRRGQCDR